MHECAQGCARMNQGCTRAHRDEGGCTVMWEGAQACVEMFEDTQVCTAMWESAPERDGDAEGCTRDI